MARRGPGQTMVFGLWLLAGCGGTSSENVPDATAPDAATTLVDAGEESCLPGDLQLRPCPTCGRQERVCSSEGAWSAFSECPAALAEICGDNQDNNCNGQADEGCDCNPVARGAGSSLPLGGTITRLLADPKRCRLYAVASAPSSQLIVFDTATKTELRRLALPSAVDDITLSPNHDHLIIVNAAAKQLTRIDPSSFAVTSVTTTADPVRVEVNDQGRIYYASLRERELWSIAPGATQGADVLLTNFMTGHYAADIELSRDGNSLYMGESGTSGARISEFDIAADRFVLSDSGRWGDGYGFPGPQRYLYLSPNDKHLYYSRYQLDADNMMFVRGSASTEKVFVEDAMGRFAIGESRIIDAQLVRTVAMLPRTATSAALVGADRELWYHSATTQRIYFQSMDDYLTGVTLGQRDLTAQPLAGYSFTRLLHDPMRNRLYGLDPSRPAVIAIDAASKATLAEIVVGSQPTDLSIDPSGAYLYVGHTATQGIARVALAGPTFDAFLPTPRLPYEVKVMSGGRLVMIDDSQWTKPTLLDATTGVVIQAMPILYQGALAVTADGNTLFAGESGISGGDIRRYALTTMLAETDVSDYDNGYGFPYPMRVATALPNGSAVYYAGYLIDGADLSTLRYPLADLIRTVTADGRLAISSTKIYRVSDGMMLGNLPVASTAQTTSPDSSKLYLGNASSNSITTVDLTAY